MNSLEVTYNCHFQHRLSKMTVITYFFKGNSFFMWCGLFQLLKLKLTFCYNSFRAIRMKDANKIQFEN